MKVEWNGHPLVPANNEHLVRNPSNPFQITAYGQPENYAFPASHATETEIQQAARNFADGTTPVTVPNQSMRNQKTLSIRQKTWTFCSERPARRY